MPDAVTPPSEHLGATSAQGVCTDVLDANAIEALRQLDPKGHSNLLVRVLGAYVQSLQKLLTQLPVQAVPADAELVRQIAHTLKSSSASVGAVQMAQCCAETEKACKDGDLAQWQTNVPLLHAEARRLLAGIARAGYPAENAARDTQA